jgi:hypothetical protein
VGLTYDVGVFYEQISGGNAGSVAFFDVVGPISSITLVDDPQRFRARVIADNGNYDQTRAGNFGGPYEITNITVERSNGLSDNCGDPPAGDPVVVPNPNPRPDPGLDPEDEPTEDPTGRPVLPMPDLPNPWGDPISIPSIPLPSFGDPKYEPSNDPSPEPGEPGTPVDIPEGGEAEDTAEDGQELVGVRLEFTTVPGKPRQPGNVIGPQLYVGAAYVYMGIDGQGLELQSEGTVIESGQFFFAERPADKWKVIAALGYAVRVTPYYREVKV